MGINLDLFIFNPNTNAPSEQLNVNFKNFKTCVKLLGGGELTPAQITSDQNDFSTLDLNSDLVGVLRLSTDASRTITGFANGEQGRKIIIINVGSFNLVIANQSGSSSASNRVITGTGANLTVAADDIVVMYYDSTTARWRVVSFSDALWG